jgi:hypothetical protein
MDRRTFMKLMGGLASMPIIGRIAKPLKSETVQEGIAAVSDKGMELYEMVVAKVMKEGKKIGESGRVDSYKHPDRPDITVDVNQTDGSAEIYFDTDRGSKGYAKIDRDMETGGDELIEAEEIYKGTPEGDYYKDVEEGISGGIENLDEFTRLKKAMGGQVPAAPSQLVSESDIILGYRGPGGYQGGRSSGRSSRSSRSSGPAGGASAGGNYGGNRNPSQTYGGSVFRGGGGGGQTTTSKPTATKKGAFVNPFTGLKQHFINNARLEQAMKAGKITPEQYNIMGGIDVKETMGLGPIDTFVTAGIYNALQSALGPKFTRGNQPVMEGIADTMRVTQGAAGRAPELINTYENIIGAGLKDGGSVDLTIVRMPDITELGVESLFKTR